ncbi:hypothetical protein GDO81_009903 [Engystomops pustulosus]|uniref:Death domain-containing protein n=1 Tax=Engystomops pustulosus TaxID=76066 RepID=A0AAV7BVH2_ENGPU|nr:hypothetical protein GDO81_009903 [Engystomops pustulosus]
MASYLRPASLSTAICQALLKGGSDPTLKNLAGENFLFSVLRGAAMEGCKDSQLLISLALKHNLDLLSRNCNGLTVYDEARKISAPISVIRLLKKKTQEQQNIFLNQQNRKLLNNVTIQYNCGPDESHKMIPILDVGSWKPGRKVRLFICGQTRVGKTTFANTLKELLFLPQYFLPGKLFDTHPGQNISTELPNNMVSALIILDMNWLLQDIFGVFGNFALSPASGTNKERWHREELAAALNLTNGDVEGALDLLEAFQLVFKTQEGEYVVPGWLKKGGPERSGGCENMRGIGYRWKDCNRGMFSHFLVGRLQIQLICMFGTERCSFWKGGALVVTKAQLRIEVSEDRRNLYLIGGWRLKDAEGDCYHLLEKVGKEVEILLRNEHGQHYEKIHLCPTELRNLTVSSEVAALVGFVRSAGIIEELSGFSFQQILEAEKQNVPLCGKWSMQPWEVLFPQHDTRILSSLGMNCSSRWLEGSTLSTLCSLLDTRSPVELDWKRLGELLGKASNSTITEVEEEARNKGLSPTNLILIKYPVILYQLIQCLTQMDREDCVSAINNMMMQLKDKVENQ